MRSWWLLAVALAQSIGATSNSQDASVLEGIRSELGITGLGGFRIRDGEIQKEVVGVRKLEDPTKIQSDDKFYLMSLSRAMAATVIGILIDEGLMGWDTTLEEALPDFDGILAEGYRNVTIGMVATYRSGLAPVYGDDFLERLYGLSPVEGRNLILNRFLGKVSMVTPDITGMTAQTTSFWAAS